MTNLSSLKIGGGVIFWGLAQWYDRARLQQELARLGLAKLLPGERSPLPCLRSALATVYQGSEYLVRPLVRGEALEVVRVTPLSDEENRYSQELFAKVMEGDKVGIRPFDGALAQRITLAFREARGLISGDNVSGILTSHVLALGGTRLRPVGGIYWLEDRRLPEWEELASSLERCAVKGKCSCYTLRHIMDADAVRAVQDAITAEVLADSQKMLEEVTSGALGERALEHRLEWAESLQRRIEEYEGILSTSLPQLREACDNARSAATAATMLASACVG